MSNLLASLLDDVIRCARANRAWMMMESELQVDDARHYDGSRGNTPSSPLTSLLDDAIRYWEVTHVC